MAKFVAFLRGVNVGGRVIKMARLKTCFEEAGFENVITVLQTGNVIFDSSSTASVLKTKIETALSDKFEYPAKAQIVAVADLVQIVNNYPFKSKESWHNYVIFLENELEVPLVAEAGKQLGEHVGAGPGVVYWQVERGSTLKSPFAKLLTKSKYKEFNTNRNLNTLQKILAAAS